MAQIVDNKYTENGVTYDARTGQPVNNKPAEPLPGIAYPAGKMGSYQTDQGDQMLSEGEAKARGLGGTTPPAGGTPSTYYPRYTKSESDAASYLDNFTKPKTEAEIYEEKSKYAQSAIDGLEKHYQSILDGQKTVNEGRERGTNAISILTGLAGSTEANIAREKTDKVNQKENEAIMNQKAVAIQSIFTKVREDAAQAAKDARDEARSNAEDVLARRKTRQTEAKEQLTALAVTGTTADGLKATDAEAYNYFAEQAGGEDQLKALFVLNRPKESIKHSQIVDGKYVIAYENPLTGDIRIETADLGLPTGYNKSLDAGDRLLFMPDNWDGDTSKLVSVSKGLTPNQAADAVGSGGARGLDTGGADYGTSDYTIAAIRDSAQYGDKRLLSDERKSITSAKRALGSLELYNQVLDGTLSKEIATETFGEGTGIIKGRLRTLAGQWGGDPNAAAINATIQGIIPTVARGIFQEVGVLTDQDIANYKKTVPDINKPENANKLIELVLVRTLERAYADTLLTAAQNQTNVSGFADEYESVLKRIDKLGGSSNTAPAGTTLMLGPDGLDYHVPNAQVEAFIKEGGKKK